MSKVHKYDQRTASAPGDPGFKLERTDELKEQDLPISTLDEFMLFMMKYPVKDNLPRNTTGTVPVWKEGMVVTAREDELISSVFEKFITEGFTGAPVVDMYGAYTGYITMADIVTYAVELFRRSRLPLTEDSYTRFLSATSPFQLARVEQLMRKTFDTWDKKGLKAINGDYSLFACIEMMARSGSKYLPLVDNLGSINGILTESMCISLLSQNVDLLGDFCKVKVSEMFSNLMWTVQSVYETQPVIDAFEKMSTRDIRGVAVLNFSGKLVNTISMRDLRAIGFNSEKFSRLWMNCKKFKETARKEFNVQTPWVPLVVTRNGSIKQVLELMDDGNIHRIFVVDNKSSMKPLYVISQVDILKFCLSWFNKTRSTLQVR